MPVRVQTVTSLSEVARANRDGGTWESTVFLIGASYTQLIGILPGRNMVSVRLDVLVYQES